MVSGLPIKSNNTNLTGEELRIAPVHWGRLTTADTHPKPADSPPVLAQISIECTVTPHTVLPCIVAVDKIEIWDSKRTCHKTKWF